MKEILEKEFKPVYLQIIDESHLHAGHVGAKAGESTHFNVTIVSSLFNGLTMIQQHRLVNQALNDLLKKSVHALALKTISADKWHSQ